MITVHLQVNVQCDESPQVVRIHKNVRLDGRTGELIPQGSVCKMTVYKKGKTSSCYVILYGHTLWLWNGNSSPISKAIERTVFMDSAVRERLGVSVDTQYRFRIEKTNLLGRIAFALSSSDRSYRAAMWIAACTVTVGALLTAHSIYTLF